MTELKCPYCWADCPRVGEQAGTRLCPSCGHRLEHDYASTPSRVIATIGSSESGKSTYIGVLISELTNRVGRAFDGMATELVGDASKTRYREVFAGPLLEQYRTVSRTDRIRSTRVLEPLLFMTRRPRGGNRLIAGMNVFYDTAGEDVVTETGIGPLGTYLAAADAIIFVVDPLQISTVRTAVAGSTPLPEQARNQVEMLQRTAALLRERHGVAPSRRIRTPLALTVAKTDAVRSLLAPGSPLLRTGRHDGHYDDGDGLLVHDEVRALLHEWTDGEALVAGVEASFATHRFFGMSALGASPLSAADVSPRGIHPLRVEDPMLWLMARFGQIPVRSADR